MMSKSIFQSKTFWFNIVAAGVQFIPQVANAIPQPWGAIVQSLANVVLRYITTQPVTIL